MVWRLVAPGSRNSTVIWKQVFKNSVIFQQKIIFFPIAFCAGEYENTANVIKRSILLHCYTGKLIFLCYSWENLSLIRYSSSSNENYSGKFIFQFRQLRRQMLFTRSLMISATDQYWSSGRKTCINYSHNLTSWDQSSANDAAVVHPFWLILLMQAFPNDVINGLHPFESHSRSRPLNHQAWGCAQIVLGTGLPSSHLIPLENPTFHSSHTLEYPTTQRHSSFDSKPNS